MLYKLPSGKASIEINGSETEITVPSNAKVRNEALRECLVQLAKLSAENGALKAEVRRLKDNSPELPYGFQ